MLTFLSFQDKVTQMHTLRPNEMPGHQSYHSTISGPEAEKILKASSKRNCYLTRYSKNNEAYTLSVIYIHNNQDRVSHLKLSIDDEKSQYSLEGKKKTFTTLNDLLQTYEHSPLSPEIRSLGSPCVPENLRQRTISYPSSQEESLPSDSSYVMKHMNEITKEMFQTLTKQTQAHMQQMNDQRKYFTDQFEKEQQSLRELIANQRLDENKRAEDQKNREEQREKEFKTIIEKYEKQREHENVKLLQEQKKAEENEKIKKLEEIISEQSKRFDEKQKLEEQQKAEEENKYKELEEKLKLQNKQFEEQQQKLDEQRKADEEQRKADEEQRKADEEQRKADEEQRKADEEQRKADEEQRIKELEEEIRNKKTCSIS